MKIIIVISLIGSFIYSVTFKSLESASVQDEKKWEVPAKFKTMKNPVASDAESLSIGKELYNKHCKSCHGTKGKGDGPKSMELETPSGDFTTVDFQKQTDGELFYKTKEGRDDMPSFKKKISEDEDIWSIVNYVRKFKT